MDGCAFLDAGEVEGGFVGGVGGEDEGAVVGDGFFYRQRPRVFLVEAGEAMEARVEGADWKKFDCSGDLFY